MAWFAYRDKEKKIIAIAEEMGDRDKHIVFYCPDKKCTAHMHIMNLESEYRDPFFRSFPTVPHVLGCRYAAENDEKDKMFRMESALKYIAWEDELTESEKQKFLNVNFPNTLIQLYHLCKHFEYGQMYQGHHLSFYLLDERSYMKFTTLWIGWKMIEAKFLRSDDDLLEIDTFSPIVGQGNTFVLRYKNEELYKKHRDVMIKNPEKWVVCAEWRSHKTPSDEIMYYGEVISDGQISIID